MSRRYVSTNFSFIMMINDDNDDKYCYNRKENNKVKCEKYKNYSNRIQKSFTSIILP